MSLDGVGIVYIIKINKENKNNVVGWCWHNNIV